MALNDLTGQNIQDTYQKVVQTDGTNLANGTGSILPISFDGNNVIISGSLIAQTYTVSESIINVSSGSTIFGNSLDDTHTMTGSLEVLGKITGSNRMVINASGSNAKIILNDTTGDPSINFKSNGTQKAVIGYDTSEGYNKFVAGTSMAGVTGIVMDANGRVGIGGNPISSSIDYRLNIIGNLRVSRDLYSGLTVQADVGFKHGANEPSNVEFATFKSSDNTQGFWLGNSGNETSHKLITFFGKPVGDDTPTDFLTIGRYGHITSSGNISASGEIIADTIRGISGVVGTISTQAQPNITSLGILTNITASGGISSSERIIVKEVVTSGDISASGTVTAEHLGSSDDARIQDNLEVGGEAQFGTTTFMVAQPSTVHVTGDIKTTTNITASSDISASGTVFAKRLYESGQQISEIYLSSSPFSEDGISASLGVNATLIRGLTAAGISGSLGSNATLIRSLTAAGISGSWQGQNFLTASPFTAAGISASLGTNATLIRTLTAAGISSSINSPLTTISSSKSVTASGFFTDGNVSASGDVRAQTIYGHQFEHFTSNFRYEFIGRTAAVAGGDQLDNMVFMPISDQSTNEHATSATNINIQRVSVVPGRPIKTTIRNATNVNLNQWEITGSVFYNQPGQGSSGASPGDTNAGQKHLVTARTKGAASNHNAIELDFTNPDSGSWTDLPAGSRMYMTLAVSSDGGGAPGDTTYMVSNLWRWDYSQL